MTVEQMIRVGKQFAAQNPRFEENQHNVDLMIAAFKVVKRHRPQVEWSVATLEELFLDLLAQGRIKPKGLEAPTQKATPPAAPSPAPRHLRNADALPVARANAERNRAAREREYQSEAAKTERRSLNKWLAEKLMDGWSSAEIRARVDAELDRALAGSTALSPRNANSAALWAMYAAARETVASTLIQMIVSS